MRVQGIGMPRVVAGASGEYGLRPMARWASKGCLPGSGWPGEALMVADTHEPDGEFRERNCRGWDFGIHCVEDE
jgi:hypothetical protein